MNTRQREYFIYRILTGKCNYKDFYIIEPDKDIIYNSLVKYNDVYQTCKDKNIYTDDDILSILIEENIWDEDLEFCLKHSIGNELNDLKIKLFEVGTTKSPEYQIISTQIDNKKEEINKLYSKRHSLISFTCEGIAEYSKLRYTIKRTVYKGKKRYKWKKHIPDYFIPAYESLYISEEIIREIARTKPWQDMWDSFKKSGSYLFHPDSSCLSNNQRRLILWSGLYENIKEHEDCPPDFIINNDNMLDGWLYKINNEKEKEEPAGAAINPKINNSAEIFMIVDGTPSEIKNKIDQIRSMNTFQSEVIKRSRIAKIKQNGSVAEQDLPDIKRELKMKLANELRRRNG